MNTAIPYGRQEITQADIDAVVSVLQSDYLTTGPTVSKFEFAFASYVNTTHAIAVANGTAALHLCTLALDLKPGQKVLCSPMTFVASVNCVRYAGAEVDFVDINPDSGLLDLDLLEQKLASEPVGTYKGIIPVDYSGLAIDMRRVRELADAYGCWIIEDACHAPGAEFLSSDGKKYTCGSGEWADLAIFSFHPVKHIACGEGGMITSRNEKIAQRLYNLRNHGITRIDDDFVDERHGAWYYEMQELGYNYRLSDIHASLGLSQLARAEVNLARRRELAQRYDEAFADSKIQMPVSSPGHAYHLYVIQSQCRKLIYEQLRQHQIYTQVHYIPVHFQPYYQALGWKKGGFPQAEKFYSRCLSLPMYPSLSNEQQDFVIEKVLELL